MNDITTTPMSTLADGEARPRRRWMTVGLIAAGLSLAGGGVAMATGLGSGADGATAGGQEVAAAQTVSDAAAAAEPISADVSAALEAFWAADYSLADVTRLADLWQVEDAYEVKARAGQLILDGKQAELGAPTPEVVDPITEAATAFWDAGYTYEDAQQLAALWSSEDTYEAKIAAGQKLLAGETLPVPPSGQVPAAG
ncbi:hypothetical protein [Cellulomonas chengniuliangii]|uniref:Uncharacterized protein n=1 Tax=Cellulomonas chengniuliangii TaxID=2968084 RepID=A0ABY5L0I3_9CELL|nr:hypothetical protein [Cellulomonas chengniuliangii]MCC2307820.1 hypothetical protein [Cellulomonas chengniuliangii]UUI75423.1 hypothetical protein NP064_00380 [Cellulomonas chengniuliangii]